VRKSGDWHNLPKILAAADRELRARTGRRAITIASARNLDTANRKLLASLIRAEDVVREETDPALVAGVRVTIENELQLDGTLARKLNRLFPETA
jgi:F0F1-type ATP synthase delta subunit